MDIYKIYWSAFIKVNATKTPINGIGYIVAPNQQQAIADQINLLKGRYNNGVMSVVDFSVTQIGFASCANVLPIIINRPINYHHPHMH